jgi:hypothetical protein
LWLPNKLEVQVEFMKNNSRQLGLIYSDAIAFMKENGTSRIVGTLFKNRKPCRGRITKDLLVENFIPCSTVLISKKCFEKVGYFDESLPLCEDHDLWLRVSKHFFIDYQNKILVKYRSRGDSLTTNLEKLLLTQIRLRKQAILRNPNIVEYSDSKYFFLFSKPLLNLGIYYFSQGKNMDARKILKEYLVWYSYNLIVYILLLMTYFPFKRITTFFLSVARKVL